MEGTRYVRSAEYPTYGSWLRSKNLQTHVGVRHDAITGWDSNLDRFDAAVAEGVIPETTRKPDVDRALDSLRTRKD